MTEQNVGTGESTPSDSSPVNSNPDDSTVPEPNTRPGPTDQGGHGGMATREQEARLRRKQSAGKENHDGEGSEGAS